MNDTIHERIQVTKRNLTLRIVFYIFLIIFSLGVTVFILSSSKSTEPAFIAAVVGVWLLFLLFCLFKIYRSRGSHRVFRKGSLTVGELDDMDGIAFEELSCQILLANGFELAENTPATGDFGVDILAKKDGISYAIQCKRYQEPVGLEAIQQVYAGRAYYDCHVAAVLTNQTFTANAWKLADKLGVVLWDREALRELL